MISVFSIAANNLHKSHYYVYNTLNIYSSHNLIYCAIFNIILIFVFKMSFFQLYFIG